MGKNARRLTREERLHQKNALLEQEQKWIQTLQRAKKAKPSLAKLIHTIQKNQNVKPRNIKDEETKKVAQYFKKLKGQHQREVFVTILKQLHRQKCHKLLKDLCYISAIYNIAANSGALIRNPDHWVRKSYKPARQISDLIRFCFVRYRVPRFMDRAWFDNSENGKLYQSWFIEIGNGGSVRKLRKTPVQMTKKIAHYFLQAPDHLHIVQALRWAQVKGMDGSNRLAELIAGCWLSWNNFEHESFWKMVLLFLATRPLTKPKKLWDILNYLHQQREANPNFEMKGRTMEALTRQAEEWQRRENLQKVDPTLNWDASGIEEFYEINEESEILYTITELLSAKELTLEGRKMKHCVRTYAEDCVEKKCHIFSLKEISDFDVPKTLATIEVNDKKKIVQAQAKCNESLNKKVKSIVERWAKREKLKIAKNI